MSLLLIRADAGQETGAGHVMRCLALAAAWRARGRQVLLAVEPDVPELVPRLAHEDVQVARVEPGEDGSHTAALAEEHGAAWAVLDGYGFGARFQQRVRESGARLLVLDDGARLDGHAAELVLDQNPAVEPGDYQDAGRLLLGPRYALLRPEFLPHPPRGPSAGAARVLVTSGGGDRSLAGRLAGDLRAAGVEAEALLSPVDDMAALLAGFDAAVVPAGGTLWELIYMGVLPLSLHRDRFQERVVDELAARGLAVALGPVGEARPERLARAVRAALADRAQRERVAREGRDLIDGRGASRVVDAMDAWSG